MRIFIKMKKPFYQEIEIPEGVEVKIEGNEIEVKGPEGENKKEFNVGKCDVVQKEGKIIIGHKNASKREKKLANTVGAHIKNMMRGVKEKFEYELKICSGHFPITVKIEGNKAVVKNFFGEKVERNCQILEGAEVDVKKDIITIKSVDKEVAGQTAANFEAATKVRNRDVRIFQDGIYITKKDNKSI